MELERNINVWNFGSMPKLPHIDGYSNHPLWNKTITCDDWLWVGWLFLQGKNRTYKYLYPLLSIKHAKFDCGFHPHNLQAEYLFCFHCFKPPLKILEFYLFCDWCFPTLYQLHQYQSDHELLCWQSQKVPLDELHFLFGQGRSFLYKQPGTA